MTKLYSKHRLGKIMLYIATDSAVMVLSLLTAAALWFDGVIPGSHNIMAPEGAWALFFPLAAAGVAVCICVISIFQLYNNLWKYASIDEVFKIFLASITVFVLLYIFARFIIEGGVAAIFPRRLFFLAWLIFVTAFTFSRFGYRAVRRMFIYFGHIASGRAGCKRVMVVGAGFAGYGIIRGILGQKIRDRIPVIIVDDDPGKHNTNILGVRVLQGFGRIPEYSEKFKVDEIIIAKDLQDNIQLRDIIGQCTSTECTIKILPPMSEISYGEDYSANFKPRDLNISDLLSREEVQLDDKNIRAYLAGRVVIVTGGGGSIGSELCRQISGYNPKELVILDNYEHDAYMLKNELMQRFGERISVSLRIGSVQDAKRVAEIFNEFSPDVVFHAAAHKHVPLMEESPGEAVKNNIFGALNVFEAADRFGAAKLVMLSTDKAVNPSSIMGATKRVNEILMQELAKNSKTKFMAVRFGNVLGSKGSIIPLLQQQIAAGGPVSVTHPEAARYFMTIPEAVGLVLEAASLGKSGRIFVLDMGEPVLVDTLARNLIRLSGLRPGRDIAIEYTGLRQGDKLGEELFMDEEMGGIQKTKHKKIFITKPIEYNSDSLNESLSRLRNAASSNPVRRGEVELILRQLVPSFGEYKNKHGSEEAQCIS